MTDTAVPRVPRLVHHEVTPDAKGRHWSDIVGCLALFALAVLVVVRAPAVSLALVPVVGYDVAVGLVFLIRGRSRAGIAGWGPRVAAHGGTFLVPIFLAVASAWAPSWLTPITHTFPRAARWALPVGNVLIMAGAVLAIWGLWHLRASLSIEPAARGLVMRGPYAVARHPLYLAYVLSYTGLALQRPTVPMIVVVVVWFVMTCARIHYEESLLTAVFPEYAAYRARVGAFGPKVWRAT